MFLVTVDQPSQRVLGAREIAFESLAAMVGWMLGAERLQSPLALGVDQSWVLEQREHLGPDQLVDLLDPHWTVRADTSLWAGGSYLLPSMGGWLSV
jgi:hypothetical protein